MEMYSLSQPRRPSEKRPSFLQNLLNHLSEYSRGSKIHGVKYLGEERRTVVEKLWWLVFLALSFSAGVYMIIQTFDKWQKTPTIISLARSPMQIWLIPFPAVTICSETKAKQTIFNFTEHYQRTLLSSLTAEENELMEKVSLVCDSHLYPQGNETIDDNAIDFITGLAPHFDEVFYECRWMNKVRNCSELFTPTLSEEGNCFTFNMLDRNEFFTKAFFQNRSYSHHSLTSSWTLEKGYAKGKEQESFPRRTTLAGQGASLSILLRTYEKDLDYVCRGPVQGFKLLLHHPSEVPRFSQYYFRVPLNQDVTFAIKPDMIMTSHGLKNYSPQKRQCYLPSERRLQFFQVYTHHNCETECLANYTLKQCGCVSFHMLHEIATPVCGAGKTHCVHTAQTDLLKQDVERNLNNYNQDKSGVMGDGAVSYPLCRCLPACTSLTYTSEISQTDVNWNKYFEATKANMTALTGTRISGVTLFFKDTQFIASERTELYDPVKFLANCGSLLNLFLGFSIVSVIELLYFLWLRLLRTIRNYIFGADSEYLLENNACGTEH